jgi:hypothetical protein
VWGEQHAHVVLPGTAWLQASHEFVGKSKDPQRAMAAKAALQIMAKVCAPAGSASIGHDALLAAPTHSPTHAHLGPPIPSTPLPACPIAEKAGIAAAAQLLCGR